MTWPGSPTSDRSSQRVHPRRQWFPSPDQDAAAESGFGDEFDGFEEGAHLAEDDDFGDFDNGFEGSLAAEELPEHPPTFVSRPYSISSQNFFAPRAHSSALLLMV